jgi:hypothetical protein
MKNKLLVLVALVATAGFLMAWGCGGKATIGAGTEEYSGESVPVMLIAGGGSESSVGSVTKDLVSPPMSGSSEGLIYMPGQTVTITGCVFDMNTLSDSADTPIVGDLASPYGLTEAAAACVTGGKSAKNCLAWAI